MLLPGLSPEESAQVRAVLAGTALLSLLLPTEGIKSATAMAGDLSRRATL